MTPSATGKVRVTARAVSTLYLYRAATGFIVAYPIARAFGAAGSIARPDGDLVLFRASGTFLLEVLRLGARAISTSLESGSVIAFAFALGGLIPLSIAIVDILNPRSSRSERWSAAAVHTPTLFLLSGVTLLVECAIAALTAFAVSGVRSLTDSIRNEAVADLIPLIVGAVGLALIGAVGILQDLARVAAIRHGLRGVALLRMAGKAAAAEPRAVLFAFAAPAVAMGAIVCTAGALTSLLDVSRPSGWRVAGVCAEHQLAILAIVTLRLVTLRNALVIVDRQTLD